MDKVIKILLFLLLNSKTLGFSGELSNKCTQDQINQDIENICESLASFKALYDDTDLKKHLKGGCHSGYFSSYRDIILESADKKECKSMLDSIAFQDTATLPKDKKNEDELVLGSAAQLDQPRICTQNLCSGVSTLHSIQESLPILGFDFMGSAFNTIPSQYRVKLNSPQTVLPSSEGSSEQCEKCLNKVMDSSYGLDGSPRKPDSEILKEINEHYIKLMEDKFVNMVGMLKEDSYLLDYDLLNMQSNCLDSDAKELVKQNKEKLKEYNPDEVVETCEDGHKVRVRNLKTNLYSAFPSKKNASELLVALKELSEVELKGTEMIDIFGHPDPKPEEYLKLLENNDKRSLISSKVLQDKISKIAERFKEKKTSEMIAKAKLEDPLFNYFIQGSIRSFRDIKVDVLVDRDGNIQPDNYLPALYDTDENANIQSIENKKLSSSIAENTCKQLNEISKQVNNLKSRKIFNNGEIDFAISEEPNIKKSISFSVDHLQANRKKSLNKAEAWTLGKLKCQYGEKYNRDDLNKMPIKTGTEQPSSLAFGVDGNKYHRFSGYIKLYCSDHKRIDELIKSSRLQRLYWANNHCDNGSCRSRKVNRSIKQAYKESIARNNSTNPQKQILSYDKGTGTAPKNSTLGSIGDYNPNRRIASTSTAKSKLNNRKDQPSKRRNDNLESNSAIKKGRYESTQVDSPYKDKIDSLLSRLEKEEKKNRELQKNLESKSKLPSTGNVGRNVSSDFRTTKTRGSSSVAAAPGSKLMDMNNNQLSEYLGARTSGLSDNQRSLLKDMIRGNLESAAEGVVRLKVDSSKIKDLDAVEIYEILSDSEKAIIKEAIASHSKILIREENDEVLREILPESTDYKLMSELVDSESVDKVQVKDKEVDLKRLYYLEMINSANEIL